IGTELPVLAGGGERHSELFVVGAEGGWCWVRCQSPSELTSQRQQLLPNFRVLVAQPDDEALERAIEPGTCFVRDHAQFDGAPGDVSCRPIELTDLCQSAHRRASNASASIPAGDRHPRLSSGTGMPPMDR